MALYFPGECCPSSFDPWGCPDICPPPPPLPCPPPPEPISTQVIFPVTPGTPVNAGTTNFAVVDTNGTHSNIPFVQAVTGTGVSNVTSGVTVGLNLSNIYSMWPASISMRVVVEGAYSGGAPARRVYETASPTPVITSAFNVAIAFTDGTWDLDNSATKMTIYVYSA